MSNSDKPLFGTFSGSIKCPYCNVVMHHTESGHLECRFGDCGHYGDRYEMPKVQLTKVPNIPAEKVFKELGI